MIRRDFSSHARSTWDDDRGETPIVRRLEALASDLPDANERLARSRGLVLAEFAAWRAEAAPAVRRATPMRRRLAFAMVAATFVLAVTAGGIAASGPGMPAYDVRLAVETLLLPTAPDARLAAQFDRLDRRLAEASAAEDERAVAAALRAYEQIALQIRAGHHADEATERAIAARLGTQRGRIEQLAGTDAGGWRHALLSTDGLLEWLSGHETDDGGHETRDGEGGAVEPSHAASHSAPSPSGPPPSSGVRPSGGEQHHGPDENGSSGSGGPSSRGGR